jgi:FlaA1/EpsC-like NDP-sugar epimerase
MAGRPIAVPDNPDHADLIMLDLIGRTSPLFEGDVVNHAREIRDRVAHSRFLVIGGAGSIGQAVCKEVFRRGPAALHVVDINENNLVELVRDLRSTIGYIEGDFKTFAIDIGSVGFEAMVKRLGPYDYVLNLAALKHVRSEKDPFTLMRMVDVNVIGTLESMRIARRARAVKYFCVSTDKAANPVNMMGGSKRIMEMFLMRESEHLPVSTARFANVAFSDGSLLHGFNQRFAKQQPISAPRDVRRYFVTPEESGQLCLMSCLLGENRDIFFPKLSEQLHLTTFSEIAVRYLVRRGFEPYECSSEDEARSRASELIEARKWPCYFFDSDTTGEKDFEEFFTESETIHMDRFESIGVIENLTRYEDTKLEHFLETIRGLKRAGEWRRQDLVDLFHDLLANFDHKDTGRFLDERM